MIEEQDLTMLLCREKLKKAKKQGCAISYLGISNYLTDCKIKRPGKIKYNPTDIVNALYSKIAKPIIVKAIDELIEMWENKDEKVQKYFGFVGVGKGKKRKNRKKRKAKRIVVVSSLKF